MMMTAARRHDKRVGYIRVSSVEQNIDRQLDGQELDKLFTDRASGKDTKRPSCKRPWTTSAKATNSLSTAWIG